MPAGETDIVSQNYLDRSLVTMAHPYDSNSSQNESSQSGPYQANTTLPFIPLQRSISFHSTALDADHASAPKTGQEDLEKLTDKAFIRYANGKAIMFDHLLSVVLLMSF